MQLGSDMQFEQRQIYDRVLDRVTLQPEFGDFTDARV